MPLIAAPIVIGRNAWLGADVFVGPGVTIGELAVVGARAVVVGDLPARQVCVGSPCRPIRPQPPHPPPTLALPGRAPPAGQGNSYQTRRTIIPTPDEPRPDRPRRHPPTPPYHPTSGHAAGRNDARRSPQPREPLGRWHRPRPMLAAPPPALESQAPAETTTPPLPLTPGHPPAPAPPHRPRPPGSSPNALSAPPPPPPAPSPPPARRTLPHLLATHHAPHAPTRRRPAPPQPLPANHPPCGRAQPPGPPPTTRLRGRRWGLL